jgi:hypothetical protein
MCGSATSQQSEQIHFKYINLQIYLYKAKQAQKNGCGSIARI